MMRKIILPGSQDFGVPAAQLIKVASGGLRGSDLRDFIKRAGAQMCDAMQKVAFAPGEIPIHLIAIGATEFYGQNRNGDGFSEECCRRYHPTFVKHARWYRNHQNKDPDKSYGIIKFAMYNEPMHRIELLVALNGTKEAARRNKGLVADRELEKLASGAENWGVSMACKVAYDVCSICGNKARTRDDYCTGIEEGGKCAGGGCKNNLCKVAEDGSVTFVDNPHPTWFDISDVYKPADRIAYVFGKLQKAASSRTMGGAELADAVDLTLPFDLVAANITDRKLRAQMKIAADLAEMEGNILAGKIKTGCAIPDTRTSVDGLETLGQDPKQRAMVLKALAREKIALSLVDFIQFTGGYGRDRAEELAGKVQPFVSGVFSRMCRDTEKLASDLANNPFRPADVEPSGEWTVWAKRQARNASLTPELIQKRAWVQAINEEVVKVDTTARWLKVNNTAYEGIANAYGLYKLAFLGEIQDTDPNFALTANLTLRQNYIS